jgi:hypothetical protein
VPIALRDANLASFSSREIAVATEVLDAMRTRNAKGISTLSHRFEGWRLAEDRETIPYEVALVEFKKPRKADIEKARAKSDELAALRADMQRGNAQ